MCSVNSEKEIFVFSFLFWLVGCFLAHNTYKLMACIISVRIKLYCNNVNYANYSKTKPTLPAYGVITIVSSANRIVSRDDKSTSISLNSKICTKMLET